MMHQRASQMAQWQRICLPIQQTQETQVWSMGQEDPLEEGMATPSSLFLLENPMDRRAWQATIQKSLAGYNPRGLKELDTTEHT